VGWLIEIILRDYGPEDFSQVISVFKDSCQTLKKSNGGTHPDDAVDHLLKGTDMQILGRITGGAKLIVAEVKETGQIVGTGGVKRGKFDRLFGVACSVAHYVRSDFQKGKAGVSVGSLLRRESLARAAAAGCRKMYGFSTADAIGFHKKFGARFLPRYDRPYINGIVPSHYYEMELRPSIWNRLEPMPILFAFEGVVFWTRFLRFMLKGAPFSLLSKDERAVWLEIFKAIFLPPPKEGAKPKASG